MIDKSLNQIGIAEIESLVTYRRTEGRTLDFKLTFPGASDRAVKDFLADITAFANTDGGDIVFGIKDDGNGAADELVGIDSGTIDVDLLRIEDQIRNCIDPRVPDFAVREIAISSGKIVLVLRVGASLVAPHRVIFNKSSRFYARNSRGNYEMSTGELRRAFAASDETPRKIRDLHRDAVEATNGNNMPCRLVDGPIAVMTIAPMSVFREARDIRMSRENAVLPALSTGSEYMVVGLEGLIVHSPIDPETKTVRTWSINHRRGYFDFAWVIGRTREGRHFVWPKNFEDQIIGATRNTLARFNVLGVQGPWVVMVTLKGIKDFRVISGYDYVTDAAWQDPAYLGDIIDDQLTPDTLLPFIDGFWRLFGVDRSPSP